ATPLRQIVRDTRLSLSVLNEQLGNGELVASQAQILAIKTVVDQLKTAIDAAASSAALTVIS
ncbi:hypothetical protein ABK046_45060, partial [Streptomyces caeruleatus]